MSLNSDNIPLPDVLPECRRAGYHGHATYNQLYHRTLSGEAPSHRVGSRRFVARADIPLVAQALGLTKEQVAA